MDESINQIKSLENYEPFLVDISHFMEDIKNQYSYPLEEAAIVENVDNCIDENYDEIYFVRKNKILEILMKGDGIPEEVFRETLPKLAATTKNLQDKAALGRYGYGMKVILFFSDKVEIETRKCNFVGKQEWIFKNGVPQYKMLNLNENEERGNDFTIVRMFLKDNYANKFTEDFIEKTLQKFYPTILCGYKVRNKEGKKRNLKFFINSKPVVSLSEIEFEKKREFKDIIIGDEAVSGKIFYTKKVVENEEDRGIKIIVHGRYITTENFGVIGTKSDKITGYVHADVLIDELAGDKTQIRKSSNKWRKLSQEISKQLSDFLKEIGEIEEKELPKEFMKKVHEELNKLLRQIPEFQKVATAKKLSEVLMQKDQGELLTSMGKGSQRVSGTEKGPGQGSGVPVTPGIEEEEALHDESGPYHATKQKRKIKRGIEMKIVSIPNEKREAWFSPGESIVYINASFPTYDKAAKEKASAYHILRCTIEALLRYVCENEGIDNIKKFEEKRNEILSLWGEIQ